MLRSPVIYSAQLDRRCQQGKNTCVSVCCNRLQNRFIYYWCFIITICPTNIIIAIIIVVVDCTSRVRGWLALLSTGRRAGTPA